MNDELRASILQARTTSALIVALGMMSENLQRLSEGDAATHTEGSFNDLIIRYNIHELDLRQYFDD